MQGPECPLLGPSLCCVCNKQPWGIVFLRTKTRCFDLLLVNPLKDQCFSPVIQSITYAGIHIEPLWGRVSNMMLMILLDVLRVSWFLSASMKQYVNLEWIDSQISPGKMDLFGISSELQFRVCNHGKPRASPHGKERRTLLQRRKGSWEGCGKQRTYCFSWLILC